MGEDRKTANDYLNSFKQSLQSSKTVNGSQQSWTINAQLTRDVEKGLTRPVLDDNQKILRKDE